MYSIFSKPTKKYFGIFFEDIFYYYKYRAKLRVKRKKLVYRGGFIYLRQQLFYKKYEIQFCFCKKVVQVVVKSSASFGSFRGADKVNDK